nr:hypothetical protein [Tanacetum cinerariifolium]
MQTDFGKDISNPFMADNLPKIVWFSTHHVTFMKSWLVQKQTALGKDSSNPLIVDSLLKTIWFSIHHHLTIEVLAIPGQTATGREYSNPFMAGVNTPRSDEDRLKLMELMVFLLQKGENVAEDVANDAIPSPPSHAIPYPSQEQSSPPQQPQSSPQALPQGKLEIIKLKARVKRLERSNKVKSSKLRRLMKVEASKRIESSDDMEDVFNQGKMIDDMDKDEGIELVVDQVKDADIAKTEGRHAAEQAEKQAEIYHLDLDHPSKVLSMQEDDSEVQEVLEVVTTAKLITDVVTVASQVSVASATISAAKPSIHAAAPTVVAAYTRRRKGVIIRDPEEELSSKTLAETPKLKDKGKGILIESPKPIKKKDQIELDVEYARKLHEEIN